MKASVRVAFQPKHRSRAELTAAAHTHGAHILTTFLSKPGVALAGLVKLDANDRTRTATARYSSIADPGKAAAEERESELHHHAHIGPHVSHMRAGVARGSLVCSPSEQACSLVRISTNTKLFLPPGFALVG